jgi:hypothetical protein
MSLSKIVDPVTCPIEHRPYYSLEQFRNSLVDNYLEIYGNVIVMEKIHGSNIQIMGHFVEGMWTILLGSRRKWISMKEKFNNFQSLFAKHESNIIALFDEATSSLESKENVVVRLYGEIYGGKYGRKSDSNAIKTQNEPNYCLGNDFAFFDMIVDGNAMYIEDMITLINKHELKVPPIIYRGNIANFLSSFDVNKFNSRVSKNYYGLDFIDTEKSTEGVTFRTLNKNPSEDESIIMKYKQTWALENGRVTGKSPKIDPNQISKVEVECLEMLNENRIISYNSKNTIDDMTNTRLIGQHIRNIIDDTLKDIDEEFPYIEYPNLNRKGLNKILSKKAFPLFKKFVNQLNARELSPEERIDSLLVENNKLMAEANILNQRVNTLNERLNSLISD